MRDKKEFNFYDYSKRKGIKCALWPDLYPLTSWCETVLDDRISRLSTKVSFWNKRCSEIADYSMNHELLHFNYDLWLWQTVSGAIASERKLNCSPNRSLETKSFSSEFWKWQHRYLLDAVRQFGNPSLFLTISPYEWSFPFPEWLDELRDSTGSSPTTLSGLETMHIVHVLEQGIRGYLTGSKDGRWKNQLFRDH